MLVRTLGAAEFGIYSLVIVFASYFGIFDFGLTWAAAHYFTDDFARGDDAALAGRLRSLQVFLGAIGAACIFGGIWIGPVLMRAVGAVADSHTRLALLMGAVSFALALQIQLLGALLRAAQQFAVFGRAVALGSVLLPIGSYAVVRLGMGLSGLVGVNAAVNFLVLSVCWISSFSLVRPGNAATRFHLSYLRQMIHFGGWSSLSRVLMIVMLQMDRLAAALAGQSSGLTYYAVPASLASRLNMVSGPAATLFFARASALHASDSGKDLAPQHGRAVRFLLWAAVALSVPLAVIGPAFLRVWIGPEMARRGGPILIVLAIGYGLSSITALHGATLEATGRPAWTARNMLCWSVPAILGITAGVARFGCVAIAVGVAFWQCGVAITNILLCRRIGLDESSKKWWGALAAALLAVGGGMLLRDRVSTALTGVEFMCVVSAIALVAGWLTILSASDRSVLVILLRQPIQNLHRLRILPKLA